MSAAAVPLDEEGIVASLDALVLGESRVVTYRTLSAACSLSTPAAKAALASYAARHAEDLVVTWAVVTSGPAVQLVRGAAPGPAEVRGEGVRSCSVWGVAKRGVDGGDACVWVAEDRARECGMAKEGLMVENELRVDRVNVVRSESAGWNGGVRREAGAVLRQGIGGPLGGKRVEKGKEGMGVKVKGKEEDTGEEGKGKEEKGKDGEKGGEGLEKGKVEGMAKVEEKKGKGKGKSKAGSAFQEKTKRILLEKEKALQAKMEKKQAGMAKFTTAASNGKEKAAATAKGSGKKGAGGDGAVGKVLEKRTTRKIEDSDEEEDEDQPDEEEDAEAAALRREAEEEERAAEERGGGGEDAMLDVDEDVDGVDGGDAEVEDVVMEKDADMVIEDSEDEGGGDDDGEDAAPENGRKHALGSAEVIGSARKRIKRIVDENYTDAKGYIVTRRVEKWFDENGEELPAEEGDGCAGAPTTAVASPAAAAAWAKKAEGGVPEKTALGKGKPGGKPKAKSKPSPPPGKGAGGASKTKKGNGNISSFFGKK